MKPTQPIAIAGTGRMAQALGRLLAEAGCPVVALGGRNLAHAQAAAEFVGTQPATLHELARLASHWLIAVSDGAVAEVAEILARAGARAGVALHTSGVHGPEALAPLTEAGVACGALHPLQTVTSPEQGRLALRGAAFALTGSGPAADWAEEIARAAGGWLLRIPAHRRAAYHAAAVLASNCLVGLLDAAVMLMGSAGVTPAEALRALAPLARASCQNALAAGPEAALTGPVRRGDAQTVALHLRALSEWPALDELYRACSLQLIALARRSGLPPERVAPIERLLRGRNQDDA
ncbi:MAG: Rossmann-like and DUF2520 domain-containing protein [Bryobacteraceae bacterium]